MKENRENWIAVLRNGRYVFIDRISNALIYDFQGFGCKNVQKCWNWIHNEQRQVGIQITPTTYD